MVYADADNGVQPWTRLPEAYGRTSLTCVIFQPPVGSMTTIGDAPVFRIAHRCETTPFLKRGSGQWSTALPFDPEPMPRSPAGMTAARAGGRPITRGRSDLRRRATPDPYATLGRSGNLAVRGRSGAGLGDTLDAASAWLGAVKIATPADLTGQWSLLLC
jgi:hypothetical protein